jgi:hypothetical protein
LTPTCRRRCSARRSECRGDAVNLHELLALLGDLPGVTLARDHEITIDLQNPSAAVAVQPAQPSTPSTSTRRFFWRRCYRLAQS